MAKRSSIETLSSDQRLFNLVIFSRVLTDSLPDNRLQVSQDLLFSSYVTYKLFVVQTRTLNNSLYYFDNCIIEKEAFILNNKNILNPIFHCRE